MPPEYDSPCCGRKCLKESFSALGGRLVLRNFLKLYLLLLRAIECLLHKSRSLLMRRGPSFRSSFLTTPRILNFRFGELLGSLEMSRRPLSPYSLTTLAIFEEYAWICRAAAIQACILCIFVELNEVKRFSISLFIDPYCIETISMNHTCKY